MYELATIAVVYIYVRFWWGAKESDGGADAPLSYASAYGWLGKALFLLCAYPLLRKKFMYLHKLSFLNVLGQF